MPVTLDDDLVDEWPDITAPAHGDNMRPSGEIRSSLLRLARRTAYLYNRLEDRYLGQIKVVPHTAFRPMSPERWESNDQDLRNAVGASSPTGEEQGYISLNEIVPVRARIVNIRISAITVDATGVPAVDRYRFRVVRRTPTFVDGESLAPTEVIAPSYAGESGGVQVLQWIGDLLFDPASEILLVEITTRSVGDSVAAALVSYVPELV